MLSVVESCLYDFWFGYAFEFGKDIFVFECPFVHSEHSWPVYVLEWSFYFIEVLSVKNS